MKTIASSATVLAVLLALSAAPAAASEKQDGDRARERPWKVLHFFERNAGDLSFLDLGSHGEGIGDRFVFSNPLFDTDDRHIGRDGVECIIVRLEPAEPPARQQIVLCTVTVKLADGQITFQGLAQGTENWFAVTGGTGAYKMVRGEALAKDIEHLKVAEITVWLYR